MTNFDIRSWKIGEKLNSTYKSIKMWCYPVEAGPYRQKWRDFRVKYPVFGKVTSLAFISGFVGLFILLLLILVVRLGGFGALPTQEELINIENSNATEIYSIDSVLIGKFYIENRTEVTLDKISPFIVTALLAVEDKRFFEHSGIDLMSWARVAKGVLTGSSGLGGGSTLSQQLSKNLYPRKKYGPSALSLLINKIKENIISIKLEKVYNKEELLILYLNTVPFGGNRYGINVASKYFYDKKASELTADESAVMIGMLKATTALNPARNPNNAKKRRDLVLHRMLENQDFNLTKKELTTVAALIEKGKIDTALYQKLIEIPIHAAKNITGSNEGSGTYFREYLRSNLMPEILSEYKKNDGTEYNLYRDGLKIYTTLHSKLQIHAESAVNKHMTYLQKQFNRHWKGYKKQKAWGNDRWINEQIKKSKRYKALAEGNTATEIIDSIFEVPVKMTIFDWKDGGGDVDTTLSPIDSIRHYFTMLNCGFMAMDHSNGYIRAWVGGTNFKSFKYDHVLGKRQVGSTFKPIVYGAALQEGIEPCSYIKNEQIEIGDWKPRNSNGNYEGWYSMMGGLTNSVNVVAAKLIDSVGLSKTMALARKMGITAHLPREAGISLGAVDLTLYEMIKVYGTIGNEGVRPEPIAILNIKDRDGNEIYDYLKSKEIEPIPEVRALSKKDAKTLRIMMQSVINNGTGRSLKSRYLSDADFAGKTGTTQNNSDGWFITFNPNLVTGAWVGAPSPAVRFRTMDLGQGAAMALPIVGQFWLNVARDKNLRKLSWSKFDEPSDDGPPFSCPLKIPFGPDTLAMMLQDPFIADEIVDGDYNEIQDIYEDYFGDQIDMDTLGMDPERVAKRRNRRYKRKSKMKRIGDNLRRVLGIGK